jgi:alkylation response protein AidB-like acyl-CoA dehydrogenase
MLKIRRFDHLDPTGRRRTFSGPSEQIEALMSHYKSNLRDIEFNMFEANDLGERLAAGEFADFDEDSVRDILREVERLAGEEWAESFVDADRNPPKLVDGEIELPPSMKRSLDAYFDAGWDRVAMPRELGGYGGPAQLRWAMSEMFYGGNASASFYLTGLLIAAVINMVGTEEQAEQWAKPMVERRWGGTMVLTEPDAGSDVGAGITKAIAVDEDKGIYHIEGVKRFITSGEYDYPENIVHLVLARREGGEPGTKGLSMFIVPKWHLSDDGSLGDRNGVVATNLEDKMGIKGSTTCELTFGVDEPCVGYLVGGTHQGIRQMFMVIEDARMSIGAKSTATLSTGYLNALAYAKERVQSADLTQALDKTAPRVEIIRHPDVRRMLMLQKSHSEGLRALLFYLAWIEDQHRLEPDEPYWAKLSDLLLPLLKGYSSEKAYELLGQSLQVFGGSGFTRDYPLEQYIRDVKIDSLYEGTTGIQALDLFFRKIARDQGQTLSRFADEILTLVKGGSDQFTTERELLGTALEEVQGHIGVLVTHAMAAMEEPAEIYKTGLHTNALLESLAEVVIGWLLLRHAEIAAMALPESGGTDRAFYEGKIAAARYFARHALPKARLRREAAATEDAALMGMPDEAF